MCSEISSPAFINPASFQKIATEGGNIVERCKKWGVGERSNLQNLAYARQAAMGPVRSEDVYNNEGVTPGYDEIDPCQETNRTLRNFKTRSRTSFLWVTQMRDLWRRLK